MKTTRLDLPVMASWMESNGRRLDCNPYLSGGFEARVLLEKLPDNQKQSLQQLTLGGMQGLINPGRIARRWVNDEEHGIPFLSSTDILQADLSTISLISKKAAKQNPKLLIKKDWILITRSGTIGRMVYSRPDMDGMACTEDVLRVIPDRTKIPPGYLYAYLSSRFGVSLITSGTYGSIIQHLEPNHIADLPVPRLGDAIENEVHQLIVKASHLRSIASDSLQKAKSEFDWLLQDIPRRKLNRSEPLVNTVSSGLVQKRFDANYHNPNATQLENIISSKTHTTIGALCQRVLLPGIFKRIHTDEIEYGAPYYSGASLYWLEPIPKALLSRKTSLFKDVQLEAGTILIQAFGQADGLVARPTWVGRHLHKATTTHMLVRLNLKDPEIAGYLYAYIDSIAGYTQISRLPYGGSIPHFDEKGISSILVPLLPKEDILRISNMVLNAFEERDEALDLELQARKLVENKISCPEVKSINKNNIF